MKWKRGVAAMTLAIALLAIGYGVGRLSSHTRQTTESAAAAGQADRKVLYWYDPMSPGTRFEKPGKSPFMDMELVPRYADEEQEESGVQISPRQQQNLGMRSAKVTRQPLPQQLTAFGTVAADQRAVVTVPALVNGQVEKLYVNAEQQQVQPGEPLAQLWVPQWAAAQQEYLAVRALADSALIAAARARLQLQFMPAEIIQRVEQSGKPQTRVVIRAPHAGYISKLNVRTGAQVSASQPLFELTSLDPVWVIIDYPQDQASQLQPGSPLSATTNSWPGVTFHGVVSELLADMVPTTRTLQARVVIDNPRQQLKPGMYLDIHLAHPEAGEPVLVISEQALIMTGSANRVVVSEGNGYFHSLPVTVGRIAGGLAEIKSGLQEGQLVVTSGQFLIDSEASLHSALPQMTESDEKSAPPPTTALYSAEGIVKAVNGDSVTIAHQPVPALQWAAMTMDFTLAPALRDTLRVGDKVTFRFSLAEEGITITTLTVVESSKEAQ